jgi:hypothetical protein
MQVGKNLRKKERKRKKGLTIARLVARHGSAFGCPLLLPVRDSSSFNIMAALVLVCS